MSALALLIEKYLAARTEHAEELYVDVAKKAKSEIKEKDAAWERAKKVFAKLEGQSTRDGKEAIWPDRRDAGNANARTDGDAGR